MVSNLFSAVGRHTKSVFVSSQRVKASKMLCTSAASTRAGGVVNLLGRRGFTSTIKPNNLSGALGVVVAEPILSNNDLSLTTLGGGGGGGYGTGLMNSHVIVGDGTSGAMGLLGATRNFASKSPTPSAPSSSATSTGGTTKAAPGKAAAVAATSTTKAGGRSSSYRNLSDLARQFDDEEEEEEEYNDEEVTPVQDYTSNKLKAGTPSPWTVFDNTAWGDDSEPSSLHPQLSKEEERKLEPFAVKIPMTEEERLEVPSETDILNVYDKHLMSRSSSHFGYPYNFNYNHEELYNFMKYSINNLGDPFVTSNYGVHSRQFECAVIDFYAKLWNIPSDEYWGYVTTCGTEGNLHGILLARECHPDGILYSSRETHYSIFKAARYYRMDAKSIPTLPMGEIDYNILAEELAANIDRPAIINVNIGTTVKGAVDNLDRILRILKQVGYKREQFHIHCDGALFAMMMPFVEYAPTISFDKPIDSIAVSGHKMLGCPMPCGVALTRKRHVKKVEQRIDYLNSVDTTIMGSRNGQAALYMWYSLRKKGLEGIKQEVLHCMETANYLKDEITKKAGMTCRLNDLSSTVVLERPMSDDFVKRWQLACEEDIAHVVVMPNVTKHKIDQFINELIEQKQQYGRRTIARHGSPLEQLTSAAWGGNYHSSNGNTTTTTTTTTTPNNNNNTNKMKKTETPVSSQDESS